MSKDVSGKVKKYKVTIFGESYFLVSDESEEHLVTAAQLVDGLMRQIAEKGQITDSKRVAVLVALQLASKTLETKDAVTLYYDKSDELITLVEKELTQHSL